ncbi:MAG: site-2 protease family protein [Patescibacteria group bacterium]
MRFFNLNFALLNFLSIIVIYNLFLGLFNLVPIPPLDGSHVLFSLLPKNTAKLRVFLIKNRLLLLFLFISFGLDILFTLVVILYSLLVG